MKEIWDSPPLSTQSDIVADRQSVTELILTSVDVNFRVGQLFLDQAKDVTLLSGREDILKGVGYRLKTKSILPEGAFLHKMYLINLSPCIY